MTRDSGAEGGIPHAEIHRRSDGQTYPGGKSHWIQTDAWGLRRSGDRTRSIYYKRKEPPHA